ncbi:SDR family NAD(P)-dependent oxidoreductase [Spirilliplanes yamanashiensis]|nr:SDR family NAD(P)-dependent oxidoreductase [Spirilliplanes yamanashiensis]MDP9816338.1 NAD(P)-dependent dehydrogenase (short-subunit alcohol dehydrogenase family) [Spirilliplanes yamanashiensis]
MTGRTVFLTGGSGGLGPAVSAALTAGGWRVVAPTRSETDLTDETAVTAAVATAAADPAAPLRAAVNLVGGFAMGGLVHETPVADFEAMLRLNLRPTYLVTAAALPHLTAAGGGAVVCVSSRAALHPFAGAAGYVTAKAALLAFADAVAVEYRASGVRCNTVVPGTIDTPANRAAQPGADPSRWTDPARIADVIAFLVSDAATSVTGARVPV